MEIHGNKCMDKKAEGFGFQMRLALFGGISLGLCSPEIYLPFNPPKPWSWTHVHPEKCPIL